MLLTQLIQYNYSSYFTRLSNDGKEAIFFRARNVLCCCLLASLLVVTPGNSWAENSKSKQKVTPKVEKTALQPEVKLPPLKMLLDHSLELLRFGTPEEAARALYLVHFYYPESPKGEPSLWQSALLVKEIALSSENPDWDGVLDRFRRYLNYYPKAPNAAAAYLELGLTYHAMNFHREAQTYFKLFIERYPDSPLVPMAMRRYGDSTIRAGQEDDAREIFASWKKSAAPDVRAIGEMGEATLKSIKGDFQGALGSYQKILKEFPGYPLSDPEILRYSGIANLRLGNTEVGRNQLYHYLTLVGRSVARGDVLLELAESYFSAQQYVAAQKIYRQVQEEGVGHERAALISDLRLAQYRDDPDIALATWHRDYDLTEQEGDKPYLVILEKLYREPIAQDARFGLFGRYQSRNELGKAQEIGRSFLRIAEPNLSNAVQTKQVEKILLYLVSELLKAKRYVDIYDIYVGEYRHVKDFPNGPLQSMMGQAMEVLSLDDIAAVLYYRAMKYQLSDQEKTDLYFRRARLYLAMKDYDAADRLLTHLRKIYQGKPEEGDVAYYSAQLSAARGDIDKAEAWYDQALDKPALSGRTSVSEEAIGLMVRDGRLEQAEAIFAKGAVGDGMAPDVQQGWLLRIGNAWREKKEWASAQLVYERGLAEGMPDKGENVQALQVYLGDVLFAQGSQEQGLIQYQAAAQGEIELWKQMANERMTQHAIDVEMAAMQKTKQPESSVAQ